MPRSCVPKSSPNMPRSCLKGARKLERTNTTVSFVEGEPAALPAASPPCPETGKKMIQTPGTAKSTWKPGKGGKDREYDPNLKSQDKKGNGWEIISEEDTDETECASKHIKRDQKYWALVPGKTRRQKEKFIAENPDWQPVIVKTQKQQKKKPGKKSAAPKGAASKASSSVWPNPSGMKTRSNRSKIEGSVHSNAAVVGAATPARRRYCEPVNKTLFQESSSKVDELDNTGAKRKPHVIESSPDVADESTPAAAVRAGESDSDDCMLIEPDKKKKKGHSSTSSRLKAGEGENSKFLVIHSACGYFKFNHYKI